MARKISLSTPLKSQSQTLAGVQRQIRKSINYASNWLPSGIRSADYLFSLLRDNVTYVDDPPGVELIQKMEDFFENNYHGIPGAGDCDCFTVVAIACAAALGWDSNVILAGNGVNASHIYAEIDDGSGFQIFDLTAPTIGVTKPYRRLQLIPVLQKSNTLAENASDMELKLSNRYDMRLRDAATIAAIVAQGIELGFKIMGGINSQEERSRFEQMFNRVASERRCRQTYNGQEYAFVDAIYAPLPVLPALVKCLTDKASKISKLTPKNRGEIRRFNRYVRVYVAMAQTVAKILAERKAAGEGANQASGGGGSGGGGGTTQIDPGRLPSQITPGRAPAAIEVQRTGASENNFLIPLLLVAALEVL